MKKAIYLLFIMLGFCFGGTVFAQTEVITDFSTTIKINEDASIDVSESITYDFSLNEKHGIYRDIPVKYKARGGNYNLRLSDISVTDETGNARPFDAYSNGDNLRIKIGDPDVLVSGQQVYVINYMVKRALNYFDSYDELYWNATGNDWIATIEQAKATVVLPQALLDNGLQAVCYAGARGSSEECLSRRYNYVSQGQVDKIVFTNDRLKGGEGLTVVVGWPKGLVVEPSAFAKLSDTVKDNAILFLPVLTLLLFYYLWRTRGRDPEGRGTIIAYYDPPDNLSPAEIGTIIDERAHKHDVSAEIINLAVKGYLKIVNIKGKGILKSADYELHKLKESSSLKNKHERELLDALFADNKSKVKLSDLKDKFYKDLEKIKKVIYQSTVTKNYFPKNPNKVRGIYLVIGGIVISLGWFLGGVFGLLGALSLALSGVIIIFFSFFMPRKTKQGAIVKEQILGLKEYLTVAEKDRIKFHNAPEKKPELFEKLLPYAMVLGVEKEWAKQFKGIYDQQPNWYSDPSGGNFSAVLLANNLGSFQAKANTNLASRPASASSRGSGFSGGFSGGGFGGGGGGSW
jgi:uncharacterized membrane protein YgcG